MNLEQFRNWAISQGSVAKFTDGNYIGECVSLINQYLGRVYGIRAGSWGNAKDWATNSTVDQYFNKVSSPQAGDIGVSGATTGNLYGHIWIYLTPNLILEQNGKVSRRVSVNAPYLKPIAILRRKGAPAQGGDEMPIPNADNYYWRYNKAMQYIRGRQMSREEFNKFFVGRSDLAMLEAMLDNPEADQWFNDGNLGRLARNDGWQQQIYSLLDQVNNLKTRPTKEELDAVKKQAGELAKSAEAANEEVKRLENEKSEDTELLDNAGSWLSKLFNRLFKKG